jgi:acyl carrier protein
MNILCVAFSRASPDFRALNHKIETPGIMLVLPQHYLLEKTEELSMADTNIESRVIEIVSEQMGVSKDQVKRETEFQKDLNADSLDVVELVMELEEEFEINIPEESQDKIKTVGAAVDFIEAELKKKSS